MIRKDKTPERCLRHFADFHPSLYRVTDPNWQEYIIMNDELDEVDGEGPGADGYPVTFIVSLTAREIFLIDDLRGKYIWAFAIASAMVDAKSWTSDYGTRKD